MSEPLFDLPPGAQGRRLGSLKARRTARQRFLIAAGYHPLSPIVRGKVLKLTAEEGAKCGTCRHLAPLDDYSDWALREMKCWINHGERVTRGAATTVRRRWPGCVNWEARP